MGLDMYLEKTRLHGHTLEEVELVNDYVDWKNTMKEYLEKGEEQDICTFAEWCNKEEPSEELVKDLACEVHEVGQYCHWLSAFDEIGYWRKANQIHNWFVENVQGGEDDCHRYEVSREQLEELLSICKNLLEFCAPHMITGKVRNGMQFKDGEWNDILEDGFTLDEEGKAYCEEMLPSCDGFFFGGTDYDDYYIDDIKNTVEILEKVLKETDFENETVFYCSSW